MRQAGSGFRLWSRIANVQMVFLLTSAMSYGKRSSGGHHTCRDIPELVPAVQKLQVAYGDRFTTATEACDVLLGQGFFAKTKQN